MITVEIQPNQLEDIRAWAKQNIENTMPFRYPFAGPFTIVITEKASLIGIVFECKNVEGDTYRIIKMEGDAVLLTADFTVDSAQSFYDLQVNGKGDIQKHMAPLASKTLTAHRNLSEAAAWLTYVFLSLSNYIVYHRQDFDMIETRERLTVKRKGRIKYANGPNAIRINQTYQLAQPIIICKEKERIRREIKCEAWSVRGHERRLKSGKTVFIKPYIKGPKRDEVSPHDVTYRV